jgi:hypothetical protein
MEALCRENVLFIAITGDNAPDYTTIATFISSMEKEIEGVFQRYCQLLWIKNLPPSGTKQITTSFPPEDFSVA